MSEKPKSSGGVAAVNRALSILDAFRQTSGTLTLKEIADATGLYKSTILRLLGSLDDYGYMRRLENGSYQLGPKLAELAAVYRESFNLDAYVVPVLDTLVEELTESATFYVAEGDSRVCLFRREAPQVLRDHVRVGDALPLEKGASGKALRTYAEGLPADGKTMEWAFTSIGERHADMAAAAAPVFDLNGTLIGALNVSGPRSRMTAKVLKQNAKVVRREAILLSEKLGAPSLRLPDV
ncbi:MAG TPA: IclR family transcriptional regulator [Maritimibacter sp.]|nr:IclR family transcriptional regulator [Maritimibacter sp.]